MILEQVLNGVMLGMVYALIAVGYSLVFGILKLLNMAHGSIYAFGAHMALFIVSMQFGLLPAFIFAILTTGVLSVLMDRIILAPLRAKNAPNITALISVMGVSYIIQNMMMIIFDSTKKTFPKLFDFGNVVFLGVTLTSTQIAMFLIALAFLVLLTVVVNYTKVGLAMRASRENARAANMMGIDVRGIVTFTFFISGMCAAVAGVLVSGYYQMVYSTMGTEAGLKGFSAAVLGGIGVLHGSVVGGIIIGVAEALAVTYLGGSFRSATAYIVLFIVLLIRPSGLFGKDNIVKV
ncbi:MAG: branched-chain amino acid ABC transporter permease [Lachnospiraceae bacterium]|jgi:branched-chain amino acid transport system permease protein|nr:branched-chain amino acid ABC transporter permease [Lachnospiraceae bacterium]